MIICEKYYCKWDSENENIINNIIIVTIRYRNNNHKILLGMELTEEDGKLYGIH